MFKKLRRRFIALSMASLLAVLIVILGSINLMNYRNVIRQADAVLDVLAENGGSFPGGMDEIETPPMPSDAPVQTPAATAAPDAAGDPLFLSVLAAHEDDEDDDDNDDDRDDEPDDDDWDDDDFVPGGGTQPQVPGGQDAPAPAGNVPAGNVPPAPPAAQQTNAPAQQTDSAAENDKINKRERKTVELSVEAPYESRYFSVAFAANGSVSDVDTGRIAAVDMETAIEYAHEAVSAGAERGFVGDYRYITVSSDDGGERAIFLDCGRNLATFRSFLLASVLTALVGSAAVFGLLVAFSGRIVRPVAESYEKQKRFITDAGHEIKTPLAIIDADADVLELDLDDENNEWLADIRRQTKRLTELTNDLVYLSRMEEQQQSLANFVEFPVSDVVSETAQGFQSRALQQEQRFSMRVQPMQSMHGDEKAIRQLTSILLDNAVKYTPEGGRIELSLERQGRNLILSVFNDAKIPVPRESMDKLFDRFYRTDPSRSSTTGGHGIGLSIARAIVQVHKGRISASTADEKSLRITAVFPAER